MKNSHLRINRNLIFILSVLLLLVLSGCMSIQEAARTGNAKEVEAQLSLGVNPNTRTLRYLISPLQEAAANGHVGVAKILLEKGADPNLRNEGGATPMHYAAKHGYVEIIKLLFENGGNARQKGTGCGTPMEWAVRNGQTKAVKVLVENGADVNYEYPLHAAVWAGHIDIVEYLISKGADVNKSKDGCTPIHCTFDRHQADKSETMKEIRKILLANGADPDVKCERHKKLEY